MNLWKRSLSLFLAVVLVLGMVPANALDVFAASVSGNVIRNEGTAISESDLFSSVKSVGNLGNSVFADSSGTYGVSINGGIGTINGISTSGDRTVQPGTYTVTYYTREKTGGQWYNPIYTYTSHSYEFVFDVYYVISVVIQDTNGDAVTNSALYMSVDGAAPITLLNGGKREVDHGATLTFTGKEVDGYTIQSISGITNPITSSGTVVLTYKADVNYTVTVSENDDHGTVMVNDSSDASVKVAADDNGNGAVSISVTPASGDGYAYYVESILVGGQPVEFTTADGVSTASATITGNTDVEVNYGLKKLEVNGSTEENPISVPYNFGTSVAGQLEQLKKDIFTAVVNSGASLPAGVKYTDLTYQFYPVGSFTGDYSSEAKELTSDNTLFKEFAARGNNCVEKIKLTWGAEGNMSAVSMDAYIRLEESRTYTITWVVGENTYTETYVHGDTVTFKGSTDRATDSKYSYVFTGWDKEIVAAGGNVSYTAQYSETPVNYKVTWVLNGGVWGENAPANNESTFGYGADIVVPTTMTKIGHSFAGWYTDESLADEFAYTLGTMPDSNITLYAKWETEEYTITFNANGGKFADDSEIREVTQLYNTEVTAPVASYTGYNFAGWYTEEGDAFLFTSETTMPADNITLIAKWDEKTGIDYVVIHYQYDLNGNPVPVATDKKSGTFNADTAAEAKNYTGFTAQPFEQKKIAADGSTVVVIYYTRNTYQVTWDNGDAVDYLYGADIVAPADPTRTYYTFTGWDGFEDGMKMPAENKNFTSTWKATTDANNNSMPDEIETAYLTFNVSGTDYGEAKLSISGVATMTWNENLGKYVVLINTVENETVTINIIATLKDTVATDGDVDYVVSNTGSVTLAAGDDVVATVEFGTHELNANDGTIYVNGSITNVGDMVNGLKDQVLKQAGLTSGNYSVVLDGAAGDYDLDNLTSGQAYLVGTALDIALAGNSKVNFVITNTDTGVSKTVQMEVKDSRLVLSIAVEDVTVSEKAEPDDLMDRIMSKVTITATNPETGDVTNVPVIADYISIADYAWPADSQTGRFTVTVSIAPLGNSTYQACDTVTLTLTCVDTTVLYEITWYDGVNEEPFKTEYVAEDTQPVAPTVTREHYTFNGWDKNVVAATEDTTYTATWVPVLDNNKNDVADEEEKYTVVYRFDENTVYSTFNELAWEAFTPTIDNPTHPTDDKQLYFAGWDADGDGEADYSAEELAALKISAPANGNTITYTAVWSTKCTVTIVYGNGKDPDYKHVEPGYDLELTAPTYDGKVFLGWKLEDGTIVSATLGELTYTLENVTANCTVVAVWGDDRNGNKLEDGSDADPFTNYVWVDDAAHGNTVLHSTDWLVTETVPTYTAEDTDKDGRVFVEWSESKSGNTITYTAVWADDSKNNNGTTDADETITVIQVGGTVTVNDDTANGEHIYDSTKDAHEIVIKPAAGYYVKSLKINDVEFDIQPKAATVKYENGVLTLSGVTLEDGMTIEVEYAEHKIEADGNLIVDVDGYSSATIFESLTKENVLKAILGTHYDANKIDEYTITMQIGTAAIKEKFYGLADWLPNVIDVNIFNIDNDWGVLADGVREVLKNAFDLNEKETFTVTWDSSDETKPVVSAQYQVTLRDNRPLANAQWKEGKDGKYNSSDLDALLNTIKGDLVGDTGITQVEWKEKPETLEVDTTYNLIVLVTLNKSEEYQANIVPIPVAVYVPAITGEIIIPETAEMIYNTSMGIDKLNEMVIAALNGENNDGIDFVPDELKDYETTVWYLARSEGTVPVRIQYTGLSGLINIDETINVPVTEAWLKIGETFPDVGEAPSQAELEELVNRMIDIYGLELLDMSNEQLLNIFMIEIDNYPEIKKYISYIGYHQFGYNNEVDENGFVVETVKLTQEDHGYTEIESNTSKISLNDERYDTYITLVKDVHVTYGFTAEELMEKLAGKIFAKTEDGDVLVDGEIVLVTDIEGMNATDENGVEIIVRFAGDDNNKFCTETVIIYIDKAPLTLSVDNRLFKYPASLDYDIDGVVITKSNGVLVDVDVINFIAGLDIHEVNIDGGLKGFVGQVQLLLPEELQSLLQSADSLLQGAGLNVSFADGASMKLSDLVKAVEAMDSLFAGTEYEEYFRVLLNVLESLPTDTVDIEIVIGGDLPRNIGVYVVGSISADSNYETAYGAGAIVITPDGIKADLDWNETDDNGIITNSLLVNGLFDTGAHATSVGEGGDIDEATSQVVEIFLGLNIDEISSEWKGLVIEMDQTKLGIGAYVEVALISDFGNVMYYAEPIFRPIVVVAETLNVDFVDASGAVNNERHFEFFNVPQDGMENILVTYKKDDVNGNYAAGDEVTDYTVKYFYVGIQTNGQPYASTEAPVHAGVYTLTAVVIVREDGVITHAGQGIGALVIEPSESTVDVENEAIRWDGEPHSFNQFVTAGSVNVPGLIPDATVITAGISADLDANIGLSAIEGTVNVDMPVWLDELLKKLGVMEAGYTENGITVDVFQDYVAKVDEAIAELEAELGEDVTAYTNAWNKIVSVINQLDGGATLTFHDDKGYTDVGAYLVVGIVTDSDHWPSADAGIVVIYPDAEKVELEYNQTWDGNNVFTWAYLQSYDLNAQANYAKDPTLNEWLTGRTVNLFAGFADHGELILTADKAELDNGVYAEVSFLLVVDNTMYYAEPIAREVIILPNNAEIDFLDENGNVNNERHFEFFDKQWAMDRILVTLVDGTTLDLTVASEGVDVFYVGVQTNGMPYASTEAPIHAGVYEVTAQYTGRDAQNRVVDLGVGAGMMVIEPSESETTVDNAIVKYDGNEHKISDMIHATSVNVPTITPDTTVISAGLSADLDTISGLASINGTVNVDLPKWLDELMIELNLLEAGYNGGVTRDTFLAYLEKANEALVELGVETEAVTKLADMIEQLPINTELTFTDGIGYTEVGAYLVVAVVTDSDHYPSAGAGVMVIYPNAIEAELKFEEDWNGNNIFTWAALKNMNLEALAYINDEVSAEASQKVTNLYVGVNSDFELVLESVSYGEHVKDLPAFKNGAYSQVAVLLDVSNEPYYAKPISRAFVVIPTPAEITFAGETEVTFDNEAHGLTVDVTVLGENVADRSGLTVRYTGVMTNGKAYDSESAPIHAGVYVVTATYTERDEHDRLVTLGAAATTLVIKPAKAEIIVENEAHEFETAFETESMITVNSDVNVAIDKTIITVTLNTDGTFSENGLDALNRDINVDLPAWLDEIMANYNVFKDGLTVAEFKAAVESVKAELAELGVNTEILDRLVNVAENFSDGSTVTFMDQAEIAPSAVGAYLVIGVVTDSNFYPAMDAGLLVIYPKAVETELTWIYEDINNNHIYTEDSLDVVDLGAVADIEAANDLLVNWFIGVDAENWEITLVDNQKNLNIGAYEEFSFIKPNVDSVIYYAEPISRPVIVVPNFYNVSINDQVVTEVFDNTGKNMGQITVTTRDGEAVDVANGTLTVTYVGLDTMLRPYCTTVEPVHAGTYTVIATYVGTDADGDQAYGVGIGKLIIQRAPADIHVESHALLHGQDYDFKVQVFHDAMNDDCKTLTIIAGVDLSAYTTEGKLGIDGTVNVDFPAVIDDVLKELFPELYVNGIGTEAFLAKYDEMVAAIEAHGYSADLLVQLKSMLTKLNAMNLTFNDAVKPTESGLYAVVAMTFDPDYQYAVDTALIAISPNATVGELEFTEAMPTVLNAEVLPYNMVADFDFSAYVSALKSTGNVTAEDILVKDVIFGLTTDLELFIGSSADKPDQMGIYDQIAYTPWTENNLMAVLPIHRDFLITDSTANVVYIDSNGYVNWLREFTYGETVDMGASIMLADGTVLDMTPNVMYIGVKNGVEFYRSSEVPTEAGLYSVVGYYVDRSENIYTIGLAELLIEPKEVTIVVDDKTMTAGDELPEFTYTVNGLVDGDVLNVTLATEADGTVAGEFEITATYTENPNYIVTVENGTLTVEHTTLFEIKVSRMNLGNALAMDFAFLQSDIIEGVEYYARIIKTYADGRDNRVEIIPMSEWGTSGSYYYVRLTDIAAKEMADDIYVQVFYVDGTEASNVWIDSIRAYAMRGIPQAGEESRTLMVDMLNYGAAAQTYFGYNTDDLANNQLTEEQQSYASDEVELTNNLVKGQNYSATRLALEDSIELKVRFDNVDASMYAIVTFQDHYGANHSFRIEGSEFQTNGTVVAIDEIVTADYKQMVKVQVFNADNDLVAEAEESVESYLARAVTGGNVLYEMIAKFTYAAYEYFHE